MCKQGKKQWKSVKRRITWIFDIILTYTNRPSQIVRTPLWLPMSLPCLATGLRYLVSYLGKRSIVTLLLQSNRRTIPAVYNYLWSGWRMTLPPPSRISRNCRLDSFYIMSYIPRSHLLQYICFSLSPHPNPFVFL